MELLNNLEVVALSSEFLKWVADILLNKVDSIKGLCKCNLQKDETNQDAIFSLFHKITVFKTWVVCFNETLATPS